MVASLKIVNGNRYVINDSKQTKQIKKGSSITNNIKVLKERKLEAVKRYTEMLEKLKNNEDVVETEFNGIVHVLNTIDTELLRVLELYDKINYVSNNKIHENQSEILLLLSDVNNLETKQMRYHTNQDDIKKIVENKKRIMHLYNEIRDIKNITFVPYEDVVDNVSDEPVVIPAMPESEEDVRVKPKKDNKSKKVTKTIDKKTTIDIDVKERAKQTLKEVFAFKNKQECISRSKSLFMSKNQIIEAIEKHQDLKRLLPDKYKNLTKEQICAYLFD